MAIFRTVFCTGSLKLAYDMDLKFDFCFRSKLLKQFMPLPLLTKGHLNS